MFLFGEEITIFLTGWYVTWKAELIFVPSLEEILIFKLVDWLKDRQTSECCVLQNQKIIPIIVALSLLIWVFYFLKIKFLKTSKSKSSSKHKFHIGNIKHFWVTHIVYISTLFFFLCQSLFILSVPDLVLFLFVSIGKILFCQFYCFILNNNG